MTPALKTKITKWLNEVAEVKNECGLGKGCHACKFNKRGADIIEALLKEIKKYDLTN